MGRYIGIFMVAFATLSLQVSLTRLLSVTTWYHLAFFAIAVAMLGMAASAVTVFRDDGARFTPDRLDDELTRACLLTGAATPVSLVLLCLLPVPIGLSVMTPVALLAVTAAAFAPFYFAGLAIALVLTRVAAHDGTPVSRLYGADLLGAACGCLFVLGGLHVMDAVSLIVLCGAGACVAGVAFGWGRAKRGTTRACAALGIALMALAHANSHERWLVPLVAKGKVDRPDLYLDDLWNAYSRVTVERPRMGVGQLWGESRRAPLRELPQHHLMIDGDAATNMRPLQFGEHLRYDLTNLAYHLRPKGGACVIGVGGGRDIQSALIFGHERVLGVELNPIFVDLLTGPMREFAGIADRKEVELVVDEARGYLARTDEQFAVLQMSMVDTWASVGAGALSLSENGLYTVEAWQLFLRRLRPDGVLTVSRWFDTKGLGDAGRLLSLAVAALLAEGVTHPEQHLVVASVGRVCTLLMSRRPFPPSELMQLRGLCRHHGFRLPVLPLPGRAPANADLRRILAARSVADLDGMVSADGLRFDPPTDDSPYFFNTLSAGALWSGFSRYKTVVVKGNVAAARVVLVLVGCLLLVALATVFLPLVRRGGGRPGWSAALYFSLIGAGFMLLEIALIQKLSVLLSHPTYALGILLFGIICSTGIGSLLSERLPARPHWFALAAAVAIPLASLGVDAIQARTVGSALSVRIGLCLAVIFPTGLLLGTFFPVGMRLVAGADAETPWYWALNGVFGVLASAVAVLLSIFVGISVTLYTAAGCYLLLAPCAWWLARGHAGEGPPADGPSA